MTKRKGFRSAVLQADVVHGVDIRVTAQLLDRISRFPGQSEVSMFNGIQPGQLVGILIQETPGGVFKLPETSSSDAKCQLYSARKLSGDSIRP
jgi:hypothetical protein